MLKINVNLLFRNSHPLYHAHLLLIIWKNQVSRLVSEFLCSDSIGETVVWRLLMRYAFALKVSKHLKFWIVTRNKTRGGVTFWFGHFGQRCVLGCCEASFCLDMQVLYLHIFSFFDKVTNLTCVTYFFPLTLLIICMVVAAGMLQHHRTIIIIIFFQHRPIFLWGLQQPYIL